MTPGASAASAAIAVAIAIRSMLCTYRGTRSTARRFNRLGRDALPAVSVAIRVALYLGAARGAGPTPGSGAVWRFRASGVPRRHRRPARRAGARRHDQPDRDQLARDEPLVEHDEPSQLRQGRL